MIARELARPAAVEAAGATGRPASLPARPAASSLQLTRVPLARIEAQLRQMLGSRLEPRPPGQTGGPDFVLVKGTRRLEISLERPTNTVHLLGDPPLVTQISRLLSALDVTEPVPGVTRQAVRIIPLQRADPAKVQQTIDALRQDSDAGPPATKPASGDTSRHEPQPRWPVRLAQHSEPAGAGKPPAAAEPDVRRIPDDGRTRRRARTAGRPAAPIGRQRRNRDPARPGRDHLAGPRSGCRRSGADHRRTGAVECRDDSPNRNLPPAARPLPVPGPDHRLGGPGLDRRPPGQDPHHAAGQAQRRCCWSAGAKRSRP